MEETPEVVEAVTETPVNPMIAIDSTVGLILAGLTFVYIGFILCFPKYCFPKYCRAQIGITLGLAAANFLRVGLTIQIGIFHTLVPIFLGCMWLANAAFIYWSMKNIERMQARTAEIQAEIERMQAELNRVENRTYTAEIWPPNPK